MTIRIVIADDSPFVREVLRDSLSRQPDFEIVGEAGDGSTAVELAHELEPDVITMDVLMPLVSGIDAIERIMRECPTPIVVVADASQDFDDLAMQAMGAGALDIFPKPAHGLDSSNLERLAGLLRVAAATPSDEYTQPPIDLNRRKILLRRIVQIEALGIVASTAGPQVVRQLLRTLKSPPKIPVAIVQHTSIGCTDAFARWCAHECHWPVNVVVDSVPAVPGVYIAPDNDHLLFSSRDELEVRRDAPVDGHRPSGTVLFQSLARHFGRGAAGLVLTGMGKDGSVGLAAIDQVGGLALVQDPNHAVIDGMPRAAMRRVRRSHALPDLELLDLFPAIGSHRG